MKALMSPTWWRNALNSSLIYAPRCILPAALMTVVAIATELGMRFYTSRLQKGQVGLEDLIAALVATMLVGLVTTACVASSLVLWLQRLTTYTRSFATMAQKDLLERIIDKSEILLAQETALKEFKGRKIFLVKYWLFTSALIALPSLVWLVAAVFKVWESAQSVSPLFTPVKLQPEVSLALTILLAQQTLYLAAYSSIALVISANSPKAPWPAALEALILSFKAYVPVTILSMVVVTVNFVVSDPLLAASLAHVPGCSGTPGMLVPDLLYDTWQGATTIVLWTLSLAPFCELLRGSYES